VRVCMCACVLYFWLFCHYDWMANKQNSIWILVNAGCLSCSRPVCSTCLKTSGTAKNIRVAPREAPTFPLPLGRNTYCGQQCPALPHGHAPHPSACTACSSRTTSDWPVLTPQIQHSSDPIGQSWAAAFQSANIVNNGKIVNVSWAY